jgi:hypothetical protein
MGGFPKIMLLTIAGLLSLLLTSAANPEAPKLATAKWGVEPIKESKVHPPNLLPSFFFMAGGEEGGAFVKQDSYHGGLGDPNPFIPEDSCPDFLFENTSPDLRVPVMPYLEQDDWGCEALSAKEPSPVDVIVAETEHLRAAITPQYGGKVWSLYHKTLKRQMFFNNPAHMPDNIGYRKAWASGGCEWNWAPGYIGHSVSTESTVWTAVIPSERGDVVRVWDYDRLNSTVWQVDILLENDTMWAHAKIHNPNPVDIDGYWWTCVAMPVTAKTRIVTPANMSSFPCTAWPYGGYNLDANVSFRGVDLDHCADANSGEGRCAWQQDMSFLGNIPAPHDFFFHIPEETDAAHPVPQLPHITHVSEDGFAVIHSHPPWMNGTKFFTWGESGFGKFQQDFMSASDFQNVNCSKDMEVAKYDPWCEHYERKVGGVCSWRVLIAHPPTLPSPPSSSPPPLPSPPSPPPSPPPYPPPPYPPPPPPPILYPP